MNLIADYYNNGFIGNCNPAYSEPITANAWFAAKNSFDEKFAIHRESAKAFFLAAFAFSYSQVGDDEVPPNCFTLEGIEIIKDAYYGPNGWWEKYFEFRKISLMFWNSLQQDPYKLYGTYPYYDAKPLPDGTTESVLFFTDYDLHPTVTKALYEEYRTKLESQMHALKVLFKLTNNDTFPTFNIPT